MLLAGVTPFKQWLLPLPGLSDICLCRHIGLWRTRVLEREITQRGRPRFSTTPGAAVESVQPQLRILVGDDSGCRSEVMVPYDPL